MRMVLYSDHLLINLVYYLVIIELLMLIFYLFAILIASNMIIETI